MRLFIFRKSDSGKIRVWIPTELQAPVKYQPKD